ncbi:MAG: hypothetical protein R3A11_06230 [Bdellovibrionota bacterium]
MVCTHKRLCHFYQALLVMILCFVTSLSHAEQNHQTQKMHQLLDQATQKEGFSQEVDQLVSLLEQQKALTKDLATLVGDASTDWKKRWVAAVTLGHIKGETAKKALVALKESPIYTLREAAYRGLMNFEETQEYRTQCLQDGALPVRSACIDMIVEKKESDSVSALAQALFSPINTYKGQSLPIREKLVWAMGQLGDRSVAPDLIRVFSEQDSLQTKVLKEKACQALGQIFPMASPAQKTSGVCSQEWEKWYEAAAQSNSSLPKVHSQLSRNLIEELIFFVS